MSALRVIEKLLKENWTEDIPDRVESVPKPEILLEKDAKNRRLEDTDVVIVKSPSPTDKDPAGLGWNEEHQLHRVEIDVRTSDANGGRDRFEGVLKPDSYEAEAYGGLQGEIERILDEHRKGVGDFHLVSAVEFDDISEQMGFGRYRAHITVELRTGAITIDAPTSGRLYVASGDTHTVDAGETESYTGATIDGTLTVNGTLILSGGT